MPSPQNGRRKKKTIFKWARSWAGRRSQSYTRYYFMFARLSLFPNFWRKKNISRLFSPSAGMYNVHTSKLLCIFVQDVVAVVRNMRTNAIIKMNRISILICTEFEVFQALEMYHAVVFSCFKIILCVGIWCFFLSFQKRNKTCARVVYLFEKFFSACWTAKAIMANCHLIADAENVCRQKSYQTLISPENVNKCDISLN